MDAVSLYFGNGNTGQRSGLPVAEKLQVQVQGHSFLMVFADQSDAGKVIP